jgi:large subunit ribosomal protein L16
MRGPELVHTKLIHKQYGIIALSGGSLKHGHYEMIRTTINRGLGLSDKAFALWRVDPPSKARTSHGMGKKLGGGKGGIDHYIMPIKRGRVIVEVGGHIEFEQVFRKLQQVAEKLPFPAKVVTQKMMEDMEEQEKQIKKQNINKLNWEWCVKNNILNCITYLGRHDLEYAHMGPDCR